jgi:uncharacterized membrane protein
MASPTPGQTNLGVAPNVGALLCYLPLCCVGFIFAVVVAIVEKQSRFLRFHAFQSLLVHGAAFALSLAIWVLSMLVAFVSGFLAFLVNVLTFVVGLAFLGVAILLMIKAYNNEEYELPVLGEMARKWA